MAWDELLALGPIPARVWNLRTDALPAKVTAELWYMPDRTQVLELSIRVPVADGDDAMSAVLEWIDERGLDLAVDQQTKTRRALELLVRSP